MAWHVRFTETEWVSSEKEYKTLRISAEIVPKEKHMRPTEPLYIEYATVEANISGPLVYRWKLEGRALEAQLVEYARRHITAQLRMNNLSDHLVFMLTTNNSPQTPEFQTSLEEFEIPFGFEVSEN